MDFALPPDPNQLITHLVQLHQRGTSPNGMFGYPIPTVIGKLQRTVTWEKYWADSFSHLLKDAIQYDNEVNSPWPEYDVACKVMFDMVIPRLLGALQWGRRKITPTLIHGDLWERNVGTEKDTGKVVIFDPGSIYAHNEMEFGTWRCFWATHFKRPEYLKLYKEYIRPSEPADEWDDRNRLYSIHAYLIASGGHQHEASRRM
jgi:fructosamine-3-kinase